MICPKFLINLRKNKPLLVIDNKPSEGFQGCVALLLSARLTILAF